MESLTFFRRSALFAMCASVFLSAACAVLPVGQAYAQTASTREACEALPNSEWRGGECVTPGTDLSDIIAVFMNLLSIIIGIVAVIMIIWGGFKYITANGDSNSLNSAKHTILYAIVGLVIVVLAQFIVQFVLENVT